MGPIYVVLALRREECALNNRWFLTYEAANAYRQSVADDSGCDMRILKVESGR